VRFAKRSGKIIADNSSLRSDNFVKWRQVFATRTWISHRRSIDLSVLETEDPNIPRV